MATNLVSPVVDTLESAGWLDRAADPVQRSVSAVLGRAPGVGNVLQGNWLGHPLHAALTDIPVGAWSAGMILDLLSTTARSFRRRRRLQQAADAVHSVGLVAVLGAAVTGIADWSQFARSSNSKRVGFVHGASNVVIAGLFGGSLLARSRRARTAGVALAASGFGLLLVSTWLGGELTYRLGVHVAFSEPKPATEPRERSGDSPIRVASP
jgi:uncharacterized membrane protein